MAYIAAAAAAAALNQTIHTSKVLTDIFTNTTNFYLQIFGFSYVILFVNDAKLTHWSSCDRRVCW